MKFLNPLVSRKMTIVSKKGSRPLFPRVYLLEFPRILGLETCPGPMSITILGFLRLLTRVSFPDETVLDRDGSNSGAILIMG